MKDFQTPADMNLSFDNYLNLEGRSNSAYADYDVSWNMDLGASSLVDNSFLADFHLDPTSFASTNLHSFTVDNFDSIPFNNNALLDPPMFSLPGQGA